MRTSIESWPYLEALLLFMPANEGEFLVASDWCEERGDDLGASWLRACELLPNTELHARYDTHSSGGCGEGNGSGECLGFGSGAGSRFGRGECTGDGGGYGQGSGFGYCSGSGSGPVVGRVDRSKETTEPDRTYEDWKMPRIGDYVMVRSHDQGVVIGYYTGGFGRNCRLERARQLFGWEAEALTLFDLAQTHPLKTALRMSKELPWVEMTEACGFLPVDPSLVEAFLNHPYNYEP